MKSYQLFVIGLLILLLQACATLTKSQCQSADWTTIGFEDGSVGHSVTYIREHRKACAEHGIKPQLGEYKQGHAQGLLVFCTPRNGFMQGKAGASYKSVCPDHLRDQFQLAYEDGYELYFIKTEVQKLRHQIQNEQVHLDGVILDITSKENLLINSGSTAVQRQLWISDLRRLRLEQTDIQALLASLEHAVSVKESQYEGLSSLYIY